MKLFHDKIFKIAYHNPDCKVIDSRLAHIEKIIKSFAEFEITTIANPVDLGAVKYDLVLIVASSWQEQSFVSWIQKVAKTMYTKHNIWIPAIVFADTTKEEKLELLPWVVEQNWYFDIVGLEGLESLPIRAANLLRINAHLHELNSYDQRLQILEQNAKNIAKSVNDLKT